MGESLLDELMRLSRKDGFLMGRGSSLSTEEQARLDDLYQTIASDLNG